MSHTTICQKELKKLGFTKRLIDKLLPEPIFKANPYSEFYPPMKLWRKSDVDKAMKSPAFLKEKYSKRHRNSKGKRNSEPDDQNIGQY